MATVYVPSPTLSKHIQNNGPMPAEDLWRLFAGLAEALRDIHHTEMIRRDIKPSNVLITDDGPGIIDFGIAKAIGRNASEIRTQTGQVIGTPPFMAPEQWQVPPTISPATDVFALGSLLVYAATGHGPFDADHPYVPPTRSSITNPTWAPCPIPCGTSSKGAWTRTRPLDPPRMNCLPWRTVAAPPVRRRTRRTRVRPARATCGAANAVSPVSSRPDSRPSACWPPGSPRR